MNSLTNQFGPNLAKLELANLKKTLNLYCLVIIGYYMSLSDHTNSNANSDFWVGDCLVEPRLNQITRGGQTQTVELQVMRLLLLLAAHPEEALSRDEIIENIWPDGAPNDESLTQAISKLRKLLGDKPQQGNMIQTIRKVGYRLVAPVTATEHSGSVAPISFSVFRRANPSRRSIRIRVDGDWLTAAAMLSITVFFVLQIV